MQVCLQCTMSRDQDNLVNSGTQQSPARDSARTPNRQQVRGHAARLVEGLTGSGDGISALLARRAALLPALLRLLAAEPPAACASLASLVNLSQDAEVAAELVTLRGVHRAADYLREGGGPAGQPGGTRVLVMLLANLTTLEEGARALAQLGDGQREGRNMCARTRVGVVNVWVWSVCA